MMRTVMNLPVMIRVLELGSMVGSLLRCCLTCSRYWRLWFCLLMMVAILPRAALFSCLHLQELHVNIITRHHKSVVRSYLYKESPNLRSLT